MASSMRTRTVLPGKPQASLQAICTGEWSRRRLIGYVSGQTLVILGGVDEIIQTIYHEGGELTTVSFEEESGKIAVGSGNRVLVYGPTGIEQGILRWVLQSSFTLLPEDGDVRSLSWGSDDEIMVGSNSLSLWETCPGKVKTLWRKPLANSVKLAVFSYNSTLVATIGQHDRLVKVWERLSFGSDDVQFGFSYLAHPRAVTNLYWRRPFHREETIDSVLYTLCVDSVLRIWAPVQSQDQGVLQLWAAIDLKNSIPTPFTESSTGPEFMSPEDHIDHSATRHVVIIDSKVFTGAAETAVRTAGNSEKQVENMNRLLEIAARNPEIIVIFDGKGRMSALGLDNVGSKSRKATNVFNIVTGETSELMTGVRSGGGDYLHFLAFSSTKSDSGGLVMLVHFLDGQIYWFDMRLDELLDPAPRKQRLKLWGAWSGHSNSINALIRTTNGKAMLSSTESGEHIVWTKYRTREFITLLKHSEIVSRDKVLQALVMDTGNLVMTLHDNYVILWNTSKLYATEIERLQYSLEGKVLSFLLLPESDDGLHTLHVVAVTSKMKGIAWEVKVGGESLIAEKNSPPHDYVKAEEHHMLLPVDPVGWTATMGGTLDRFSREVVTSITLSGFLRSWSARVSLLTSEIHWLATFTVDTGIAFASLLRGSSLGKVAIVGSQRNDLTIWATRSAQLEHQVQFEKHDVIMDLDWACTPDSQSILAVGFPHRVLLLSQLRYDYLQGGPSWAPFREINIRDYISHHIGDSIWLEDGGLVIGAGNQLHMRNRRIEAIDDVAKFLNVFPHKASNTDIFDIVSHLNGPVPVYHPQFLQQCILAGRTKLVERILVGLHKELRSYHEEIPLDNFLNIPIQAFLDPEEEHGILERRSTNVGNYFDNYAVEDEFSAFGEPLAASLCELLTKIPIPHLTGSEQMNLASIVECVAQVNKHRRSIDENGARYLLFFRQYCLGRERDRRTHKSSEESGLSWREIVWAYHSVSQEILVDLVSRSHKGRMLWKGAKESGMFMWLRDLESVRNQWEILARNHYTQKEEKNPIDCTLHYIALRKKNVLVGLWRIAHWNKEQQSTYRFLSNDFTQPRWRTAAKKNAFALLGKQRYEYAAAFFLLGDALKDCVNVCFTQLEDPQLAIAVARVYEGDDGPVLRELLEQKLLPRAVKDGNRWLATWAYWMLRKRDLAVRAIVSPLHSLLPNASNVSSPPSPGLESQLYLASDPALIILYKLLRDKTTQTLRGLEKISPAVEFEFVLHTARMYDRMGCDLLALELVKNWEFLEKGVHVDVLGKGMQKIGSGMQGRARRHRRRSSVTIADEVDGFTGGGLWGLGGMGTMGMGGGVGDLGLKSGVAMDVGSVTPVTDTGMRTGTGKTLVKPPASVFEEPDMSWAFG
ncbi:RAVE protein 1 C terminal-domain-containing protein [Kalaharituber pfeilii]|nr:RAVE protein 1 C terminal-domain-containing protein [Kalaharituber pfeilii]